MKISSHFLLILLFISACSSPKADQKSETVSEPIAEQLRNSAWERFQDYLNGSIKSPDSLKVSLTELDTAIELKPSETRFYIAKAHILLALDRDEQAIQVLKETLLIKTDYTGVFELIGFIHEKNGETEAAKEWYQKAIEEYDTLIEEDRLVITNKANRAFLLLFSEDKAAAMKAFEKLKQEYPSNNEVAFREQELLSFDKEQFFDQLFFLEIAR